MRKDVIRPLLSAVINITTVRYIGNIISDNMEYFTMDGVPRIVHTFKHFMWNNPDKYLNPDLLPDMHKCIDKTRKFINILYSYYNPDKGSKKLQPEVRMIIDDLFTENESHALFIPLS